MQTSHDLDDVQFQTPPQTPTRTGAVSGARYPKAIDTFASADVVPIARPLRPSTPKLVSHVDFPTATAAAAEFVVPKRTVDEMKGSAPAEGPTYTTDLPPTTILKDSLTSLTSAAQIATSRIISSGALSDAKDVASTAASNAASMVAGGVERAKEVVASAAESVAQVGSGSGSGESKLGTMPFTTPASSAPVEARYVPAYDVGAGHQHFEFADALTVPVTAVGPVHYEFIGEEVGSVPSLVSTTNATALPTTTAAKSIPVMYLEGGYTNRNVNININNTSASSTATTESLAARAGDVAGTVVGAVGGTVGTAAALAKDAVLGHGHLEKIEEEVKPREDVLLKAGAVVGSVAGSVAGTLAAVTAAAKEAAVSAVSSVTHLGHHHAAATVPEENRVHENPIMDVTPVPYDEENLIEIYAENDSINPNAEMEFVPLQTAALSNPTHSILGPAAQAAGYTAGAATRIKESALGGTGTGIGTHIGGVGVQDTFTGSMDGYEGCKKTLPNAPTESLPLPTTDASGLISDEAIQAVALAPGERSVRQQELVDRLLGERDLTSVGQPNTEFGSAAGPEYDFPSQTQWAYGPGIGLSSALPTEADITDASDMDLDAASNRSIPPTSASHHSLSDVDVGGYDNDDQYDYAGDGDDYESPRKFVVDAVAPTDPIPHQLASLSPATSTILEEEGGFEGTGAGAGGNLEAVGGELRGKVTGLFEKGLGKIEKALAKDQTLVDLPDDHHRAHEQKIAHEHHHAYEHDHIAASAETPCDWTVQNQMDRLAGAQ